ncbi:PhoH family protein, partial [Novipirellula sp.]
GEMIDFDQARTLMEQDVIEIIPLAYMRGRTLNDAFIILDEAQNTTVAQMKMFLTRMGERSKMVVSGDISQQDLPRGITSGLRDAIQRLSDIEGIGIVRLRRSDIVRHRLVQKIVEAYDDDKHHESESLHDESHHPRHPSEGPKNRE